MPSIRATRVLLVAGAVATVAELALLAPASPLDSFEAVMWLLPWTVAFGGGIVAFRARPDDLACRRLLAFGAVGQLFNASGYVLVTAQEHGSLSAAWWPANTLAQIIGMLLPTSLVALLAVYPDGRYQRAYERRVVVGLFVVSIVAPVLVLLGGEQLTMAWHVEWNSTTQAAIPVLANPVFVPALAFAHALPAFLLDAALGLFPAIGAALLILRHRRLAPAERLRVKWPFYAGFLMLWLPVGDLLTSSGALPILVGDLIEASLLIALPAAITIGLVRPDLFDLERVARRSLIYLFLWVTIAAAYVGIAAALGVTVGGENLNVAVAVAIVATLLFEPARRALARRAARYAYGEPVSGEDLVQRLGSALEHTLDAAELVGAIAATAREGLGARWVRIELDDGSGAHDGTDPARGERPALEAELMHAGQRLGTINCGQSAHGRLYGAAEQELLDTLARQAALGITNAQLAEQLGDRLEELRASRSRIVAAEDRARRKLERDIHDGSQQELAALIARIGLARNQLSRGDPARLEDTLEDLRSEAAQALENLRELASGIHPSVLTDRGLIEAVEARAARLPLGVTIECEPGVRERRFEEAVEAALYLFISECLANTLKHAHAERARVTITHCDGTLAVQVADDGRGFDPEQRPPGGGIDGLSDRITALGGALEVDAGPDQGVRLSASLPALERTLA